MRKLVIGLVIACVALMGWSQQAEARHRSKSTTTVIEATDSHDVLGAKIDAPNLVKIAEDWNLGVEGGKDILKDVLYSGTREFVEADRGYFAYVKVTYTGCLLGCKEKVQE